MILFIIDFISVELVGVDDFDDFVLESPITDGTIEENFEEAFGSASLIPEAVIEHREAISIFDEDFSDVAKFGIVDVVGDDIYGRKVIVVSACRLPGNEILDQNRFLRLHQLFPIYMNK